MEVYHFIYAKSRLVLMCHFLAFLMFVLSFCNIYMMKKLFVLTIGDDPTVNCPLIWMWFWTVSSGMLSEEKMYMLMRLDLLGMILSGWLRIVSLRT